VARGYGTKAGEWRGLRGRGEKTGRKRTNWECRRPQITVCGLTAGQEDYGKQRDVQDVREGGREEGSGRDTLIVVAVWGLMRTKKEEEARVSEQLVSRNRMPTESFPHRSAKAVLVRYAGFLLVLVSGSDGMIDV